LYFEDNCYINIPEQINIYITADGHPITFVEASGGPGPVRRDRLIHLIGIASKLFFLLVILSFLPGEKSIFSNISNNIYLSGSKKPPYNMQQCVGEYRRPISVRIIGWQL